MEFDFADILKETVEARRLRPPHRRRVAAGGAVRGQLQRLDAPPLTLAGHA